MSAVAECYVIDVDDLGVLADAAERDQLADEVRARGRQINAWKSSGFYAGTLAAYLSDRGLPGPTAEEGRQLLRIAEAENIGIDLYGPACREHLALLDPAGHDATQLRAYEEEFSEREDPDAGGALLEVLVAIHAGVRELGDGQALLILIPF